MREMKHYALLADVFDYPGATFFARVRATREALEGRYPLAASELGEFERLFPPVDSDCAERAVAELQEIHTRSFEVQSITTLDIGYVVFGDDYKRGELLVHLNQEHRNVGVDCGSELPDHLPNVLRLVAGWQVPELVDEFVQEILVPALRKMLREFGGSRMEQRNSLYRKHYKTLIATDAERATMYRHALAALLSVVEKDFRPADESDGMESNDFLRSIRREMEIDSVTAR
jgi:nitrate reductase assembly molybdenum cofactor insertion protein NarJ